MHATQTTLERNRDMGGTSGLETRPVRGQISRERFDAIELNYSNVSSSDVAARRTLRPSFSQKRASSAVHGGRYEPIPAWYKPSSSGLSRNAPVTYAWPSTKSRADSHFAS